MKCGRSKNEKAAQGHSAIDWIAPGAVGAASLLAFAVQAVTMLAQQQAALSEILLLLIYVEIVVMIGICLVRKRISLRYAFYITLTVIARYVAMAVEEPRLGTFLSLGAALVVLALALIALRSKDPLRP